MPRREFAGGAPATTLSAGIGTGDLSLTVAAGAGYPTGATFDFVICIDRALATEEKILCTARSGNTFTVHASGRGYDGTTAAVHALGAPVEHVIDAVTLDDYGGHVYDTARDDHTQYLEASTAAGAGLSESSRVLAVNVDGVGVEINADALRLKDLGVTTAKLADGSVTFAKTQDIASDRVLGRDTAASGDVEELTVGGGLEFSGAGGIRRSALTGDVAAPAGSGATTIADNAVTTAKILDANVTLAKLAQEAWTAYTPVLGGTGWALGNGTAVGRWRRIGRLIVGNVLVTFGSTSTFGSVSPTITLPPVTAVSASSHPGSLHDSGGADYSGMLLVGAGGAAGVVTALGVSGTVIFHNAATSTIPFAWASGDTMSFGFAFEATT